VSSLDTIRFYVNAVDTKLGMLKAASVSDETITQYKADQVKAHVAASTINHRLQVLKQALRPFYIKTLRQPMPEIKKLPEHNVRETFFSDAQAEALIAHLPADLQDFTLWGWQTGWRKGEIASLEWANVDRAAGEIRLSWTKSKTKKARVIGLDGELAAIIERRWQARTITRDGTVHLSPLVFHRGVTKSSRIIPVGDFDKVFKTACETIGIPYGRLGRLHLPLLQTDRRQEHGPFWYVRDGGHGGHGSRYQFDVPAVQHHQRRGHPAGDAARSSPAGDAGSLPCRRIERDPVEGGARLTRRLLHTHCTRNSKGQPG
jgi:integrase-like protein